ncbi:MAG: riboflavin synthase [Planctomycetota bacterium]|nr:riboflavin synthase [Planctomycetota bacterium]
MFTGIVQHVGVVRAARTTGGGARLTIDLGPLAEGLALGASVAVNGACLTAAAIAGALAEFDVMAETLKATTLGALRGGEAVNLERAMTAEGRFDGHIVQGHVDAVAKVARIDRDRGWVVHLAGGAELAAQIVRKGSVAVDGVSLTVVDVQAGEFSVALIPTTLEATTLGKLRTGQAVNIETDVIGKYVQRYLQQLAAPGGSGRGLSIETLRDAGFA